MTDDRQDKNTIPVTVRDICDALEDLAPAGTAESWDNVGLLLGDYSQPVSSAVLSLDLDQKAIHLARERKARLIITHHPVIFEPVRRLTAESPQGWRLLDCIRHDCSVYSSHTNLDAAPGGVNDALAAVLGLKVVKPVAPLLPSQAAHATPTKLRSPEMQEVLAGRFDIPRVEPGLGRICTSDDYLTRKGMVRRVNNILQTAGCMLNFDTDGMVERVAVCGGSFDEEWIPALAEERVDLVISGEIKHHVMLLLADAGIAAIAAGHEATERVVLHPLANYLRLRFPALQFAVNEGLNYNNVVF